jgi:HK97 family phage major capsid protein
MNIKELILKMLKEGKEKGAIQEALFAGELKFEGEATKELISEAFSEHEKALKIKAAFEGVEADKKAADDAEKNEKAVGEMVQKAVKDAIDSYRVQTDVKKIDGNAFESDYVKTAYIMQDNNSWQAETKAMLRAQLKGDIAEAKRISNSFLEKSKLYTPEYIKSVLRGDTTTGSYAVPDEFSDRVIVKAQRLSNIFGAATKLNMSSDKLNLLGSGDVTFTEVADQSTALTESEPVLTQTSLDLIDVGAFSYIHDNLIADSNVNIVEVLENAYSRGLTTYLKRATTVGNVATTGDLVNGVYSISGIGSVGVLDSTNGTIQYDDILNLMAQVDEVFWDGSVFEMNLRELLMIKKIKDNNGMPIMMNPLTGENFFRLLSYPVKLNNQMPNVMDSSTGARSGGTESTILFGLPSEIYIGMKGGMEFSSTQFFKFTNRQETFRGFIRWDQALVNTSAYGRLTGIKRT